jgi:peptidoglycan/LPS O-acetylase OafA/YrhL
MTRLARIGVIGVALLAVAWFGVSWAVLHSPVMDAVGEALGGVLLILVLLSALGALRRSR